MFPCRSPKDAMFRWASPRPIPDHFGAAKRAETEAVASEREELRRHRDEVVEALKKARLEAIGI